MGPNEKKLIAKRAAKIMIPDGGDVLDGFDALTGGDLARITKEACEWVSEAIEAVKAAPDNPYGDDNEAIAEAVLEMFDA